MDKKMLEAFAREAAKSIKMESDLEDFRKMLTKVTIETALNVELDEHLGYEKHTITATENARNGYSSKSIITDDGSVLKKQFYTTNAIESLNSVIRKAIKKRKLFPTDNSVRKVIYLAVIDASKKCSIRRSAPK